MTIGTLDLAIHTVNDELSFLVLADFSSSINGLFFRVVVTAGALCAASFYIPTSVRVGNNVMSRSCHFVLPLVSPGAAGSTAICVPINRFCLRDGIDLI